jgi:4'-phosphopantetheinyl transferase
VELRAGEAHLWLVRLPVGDAELARCEALLSREERARARIPREPADQRRFVAVRGTLRRLLGGYLGAAPESIRFRYGELGKPAVGGEGGSGVRFNVSHAGGVALLAFAAGREVGVDVERIRPVSRRERIVERVFAPEVARAWAALPPERREEGFFREWTRLEAAAKLTGEGVWRTVIRRAQHGREEACWPEVGRIAGYAAALAVEGGGVRLRSFCWPAAAQP